MNKHDFKVGDVIRIKTIDHIRLDDPTFIIFNTMKHFCGKLATITQVNSSDVKVDNNIWLWTYKSINPFTGFEVGDTVWTAKRGKGKIIGKSLGNWFKERPFSVKFEYPGQMHIHYPKLSNLYPTEAKMKEATEPKPDPRLIEADKKLAQLRETLDGIYKLAESNKLRFEYDFDFNSYPVLSGLLSGLPSLNEGKKTIDLTVKIN